MRHDQQKNKPPCKDLSPLGVYHQGMPWNSVEKIIFERRSIRAFKSNPLPDSMIRRILEAGRFAPSAGNAQPWKFVVVNNAELLKRMETDTVKMVKKIMWCMDYTKTPFRRIFLRPVAKLIIRFLINEFHPVPFSLLVRIASNEAPVYHRAPTLILLLMDRRGVSSPPMDVGICGQNMVLAAHSMGAGACWIGMIKLLMFYPKWRSLFGIHYPYKLTDCIAVGWSKFPADGQVHREMQHVQWFDDKKNYNNFRVEAQGGKPNEVSEAE